MIKLAKIININAESVILKIQGENCRSSGCQQQCKKNLMSFLFPNLNKGHLTVTLKSNLTTQHHVIDDQNFFSDKHLENDIVGLEFSDKHLLRLSFILYGLPIVLMLLTMIVCYKLFSVYNYPVDIGGFIGLLLGLLIASFLINHNKNIMRPSVKFFK